jgi:hypothetical protein
MVLSFARLEAALSGDVGKPHRHEDNGLISKSSVFSIV